MTGLTMKELYDCISQGHEAEFTYGNELYMLQPEIIGGKSYLSIWHCKQGGVCISRHEITDDNTITQDLIDIVLNDKCFDGKSFYEIEQEITIKTIF